MPGILMGSIVTELWKMITLRYSMVVFLNLYLSTWRYSLCSYRISRTCWMTSQFINGFHEDEDVVQVDHYHAFCDEFLKNVIHYHLKGSQAVHETEEYNKQFKQSVVCSECSLPFITFFDANIVKTSNFVKYFALWSFTISSRMSRSGYLFFMVMMFST